jgi:hypothetical protein
MSFVTTFVARLRLGGCSAVSAEVTFGSTIVAGRSAFLRAIPSLMRRVAAVVAASFHDEGRFLLIETIEGMRKMSVRQRTRRWTIKLKSLFGEVKSDWHKR